jgi:tetratricopeptide (TPR) repeat protein
MSLARLTRQEVAAWVAGSDGAAATADEVFRITEGNPLFVHEVLRVGAHAERRIANDGGLPSDGIKAALDEHLRKVLPETRVVLEAAAVLGRDFGSRELAAVLTSGHDIVLGQLRQAADIGVLETTERERFQFTHALLRDRCYETLPPSRRSELHWKAGLAVESSGADCSRVANHLLQGAGSGNAERAAVSALHAAEQALRGLAFEAAVELAERALAVLGAEPSRLSCQLEIVCGLGLIRSGSIPAGRARCVRAADFAKTLGCAEEQAQAALAYGSESTAGVDPVMVQLLEEGRRAIGPDDSQLGAKLGARLAAALMPPRTEEGANRAVAMARAAVAMARRLGDSETLLYVLDVARSGVGNLIASDERFALIRETVVLAQVLNQRLTLIKVAPSYAVNLLERGSRVEANGVLAATVELDAALDYPQARWRLPMLRACFALFEGRLDEAEQLGDAALAVAQDASYITGQEWAIQRIALAIARSEPATVGRDAARILSILERGPWGPSMRAWVLAAIGRRDEAMATLRESAGMPQGLPTLLVGAEASVLVEDRESAALIEEQLPKRALGMHFFLAGASGYVLGPTSRVLGELAALLGRPDEARLHYEESIALCRRIGAKPFLDLSLAGLARLEGPDGGRTSPIPDAQPRDEGGRPTARTVSLTREGDVWAVEGSSAPPFRLKHSKGLSYLSELLAHPGQELHVLSLVGLDHGAGDAGPMLDARAKAEYKQRLEALEDQISEADAFGDAGRADRARQELDMLATQLAGAVGLGGRDRRAASDVERARINVQRRLKDAIECVGQCDVQLGRYLAAAVKTGTYCSFTPL